MKFVRNCPRCGKEIKYTTKHGLQAAEKKATLCKHCMNLGNEVKVYKLEIGRKYNNLTVVEELEAYIEPCGKRRRIVRFLCDCGNTDDFYLTHVVTGRKKSCEECNLAEGAQKRAEYYVGDRFGKLEIIDFQYDENYSTSKRLAVCKCDCGNVITKRPELLPKLENKSCGKCIPKWAFNGVGDISQGFFYRVKRNAEVRDIAFEISMDEAWKLFLAQDKKCALSGVDLKIRSTEKMIGTASIDRIDPDKDYTIDNIQWVHKDLNTMKMDMSEQEFYNWIKIIYKHKKLDAQ